MGRPAYGLPALLLLLRTLAFAESSLLSVAGLGLMIWTRKRESILFGALFLLFPLVYYSTFVFTRYRHPIEPEMFLLIVYFVASPGRDGPA